jgi:hypothetical protein
MSTIEELKDAIKAGDVIAAHEMVRKNIAWVNTQTDEGATLLHLLSISEGEDVPKYIQKLLTWGADPLLMLHNETAYDLAIRHNKTVNAKALRFPTSKAIVERMASRTAQVAVASYVAHYALPASMQRAAAMLIEDYIRHATLTGNNFSEAVALQAGISPKQLPQMFLNRKASEIGFEQGGMMGALPAQALISTLMHAQVDSSYGIFLPDPLMTLSVHTTLGAAHYLGGQIGEMLGTSIALKRLGKEERVLQQNDKELITKYQNLGRIGGSLCCSTILSTPLYSLIQNAGNISLLATDSPIFPVAMAGAAIGASVGGFIDYKHNGRLPPAAGMLLGGLIGTATTLLSFSSWFMQEQERSNNLLAISYEPTWAEQVSQMALQSSCLIAGAGASYLLYKAGGLKKVESWAKWVMGGEEQERRLT